MKEKARKGKKTRGYKEILNRLKKLEEHITAEDKVVLICLEDGKECRKSVGIHEACMMALKQDMARMFGGEDTSSYRIIGVESGDDDNFIGALIEGSKDITPEAVGKFIQIENEPEDERYKLDPEPEPIKERPKFIRM